MTKPITMIALLLIPAILIALGFYLEKEILSSIGYVILIFYFIMAIRGKFSPREKQNK
jgi:hypothetical protein